MYLFKKKKQHFCKRIGLGFLKRKRSVHLIVNKIKNELILNSLRISIYLNKRFTFFVYLCELFNDKATIGEGWLYLTDSWDERIFSLKSLI